MLLYPRLPLFFAFEVAIPTSLPPTQCAIFEMLHLIVAFDTMLSHSVQTMMFSSTTMMES